MIVGRGCRWSLICGLGCLYVCTRVRFFEVWGGVGLLGVWVGCVLLVSGLTCRGWELVFRRLFILEKNINEFGNLKVKFGLLG